MEESHSPSPPSRSSSFELIRRLLSLRKISFSSECPSELTSLNFSVVCASRNAGAHLFSRQKIMHSQTTRNFALVSLWCGNLVPRVLSYPPYRASKRERDPGKRWSRGSRTKLILREESFVSRFFCLVYSQRSRSDRNSKIDLLTLLQL